MLDIIGDAIYFDGHVVGVVLVRSGTLRDRFTEYVTADLEAEHSEIAATRNSLAVAVSEAETSLDKMRAKLLERIVKTTDKIKEKFTLE